MPNILTPFLTTINAANRLGLPNLTGTQYAYEVPIQAVAGETVAQTQARTDAAVAAQGGLNAIIPAATRTEGSGLLSNIAIVGALAASAFGFPAAGALIKSGAQLFAPPTPPPAQLPQLRQRRSSMAFSDGDSGFFGGVDFGQILQGLGQPLLQLGTQAATGFINQQFAPQPVSYNPLQSNMAAAPVIMRAGAVVARGFFTRFPNLATAIQRLRNAGANVTRASLWNLMKRFGPDFLISGSILTAAAVSELAMAGPGRRRMNAGNIKALRKAHRRMKAFHHVCRTNDMLLGGSKRRKATPAGSSVTRITQVK